MLHPPNKQEIRIQTLILSFICDILQPMENLTQETLQQLFYYDSETGSFTRLRDASNVKAGRITGCNSNGYKVISINKKLYYAHRLAWLYVYGTWPAKDIDHINCNKSDNRLCNLREATHSQNKCNIGRKRNNKSGYKGVSWHKGAKKWDAKIRANGSRIYIGLFDTAEEASEAYERYARNLHGEFART